MILNSIAQNFRDLDVGILKLIYENRITALDSAFVVFTDTAGLLAFGIPSTLLIFSTLTKNSVLRKKAAIIFISVAISAIVANILKYTVDLPRPYELYPYIAKLGSGGSPSFPSGHTADAFAFFMALSLIKRKWFVIVPCLLWASLVGYSRMSLGVHFPSDVLAGALIGIFCALAVYWFWTKRKAKKE
jgi:membrane-associated phospholipid phosphatase